MMDNIYIAIRCVDIKCKLIKQTMRRFSNSSGLEKSPVHPIARRIQCTDTNEDIDTTHGTSTNMSTRPLFNGNIELLIYIYIYIYILCN